MSYKTRVLHIMSSDGGGISSFIKNKAIALNDSHIQFDVLTYDPVSKEFEEAIRSTGGRIYYMSNPKKSSFKQFVQEVNEAMNLNNTIVHSHIQGYRFLPFYLIAKKNKIETVIVHAHTDLDPKQNKSLESKLNRKINALLPISRISCGIKASKTIFGISLTNSRTIMHIPNSINTDDFVKKADKKKLREEIFGIEHASKKIIGNVARFNKQKNHKFMIPVIKKLSEKNDNFLWVFVGKGELEEKIRHSVKEANLEDVVLFMGRRNDVPNILKAIDLFALPSLYEGLPTVAIEAQAAGTPILLSDTITNESDLDLGLVRFLPLETDAWVEAILTSTFPEIQNDQIIVKLNEKKFTNEESAKLYKRYLYGEIETYEI